jgi:hypothetical protein
MFVNGQRKPDLTSLLIQFDSYLLFENSTLMVVFIGDIAKQLYTKYNNMLENKTDLNANICALYEASLHSLKVHDANEGLDLLLQSKRIVFDLALDLKFLEKFSMAVIIRYVTFFKS